MNQNVFDTNTLKRLPLDAFSNMDVITVGIIAVSALSVIGKIISSGYHMNGSSDGFDIGPS